MVNPKIKAIITAEDRASATFNKFSKNLKLAGLAIAGVTAAIGYKSVKAFTSFEQQMSDVSTLVDTSKFNMDAFGKSILSMTKTIPRSADELGAAAYKVVSAGITDASEALDVLRESSILAVSGLGTSEEAVNLMSVAMNNFGDAGYTAHEVANILFKTVRSGITTVSELTANFGKMAATGNAANVTLEEMQAATAAVSTVTANTAMSQTMLTRLFDELTKSGTELAEAFKGIGIENIALEIKNKGLKDTLDVLYNSVGRNNVAFKNLFGNVRSGQAALFMITSASKEYNETLKEMESGVDDLSIAFAKQQKTLKSQIQLVKNYGQVFMITVGKGITAALKLAITETLKYGEATNEAVSISLALYDALSYLMIGFKTISNAIAIVIEKINGGIWAFKALGAIIRRDWKALEEAKMQMDLSSASVENLRNQVFNLAFGYTETRRTLKESLMSTSEMMKAQKEQLELEKQLEDALGNSAGAYGDVGKAAEEAKEKIKDYLKEMDKIFMQGVNARLSENEKYRKEAAEIVIDTEKKIDEIEKEMAEKKREYEIEKAKAVANGSNEQLRELEYRYKEEIAGLETQKAEAEDILYTAHLHEKEFIEEIEELRKRNSMNELARLMYDHNKKIVTITEETQKEIDAVKEKIQAAIEEGVAKREEMKKTTDTNIALMKETTTAHKAELDTQLNNLKTHVAQSNAVIETLKSSPANLLTGFSSRAPSIFQPPWMAEGGIVTKPTLAMVGESGPEAVVPLNKTLGNINITITGNTFMSDDEAAVRIGDMIINELKLGNRV